MPEVGIQKVRTSIKAASLKKEKKIKKRIAPSP